MQKGKKTIALAVSGAALLILLCAIYLIKNSGRVSQQFTMELYGENGEVVQAEFDLAWQKHAFAPTELRGSVTLNGLTYVCIKDTDMEVNWYHGLEGFFSKISSKLHGRKDLPNFILPADETIGWGFLAFYTVSDDFRSIGLNVPVDTDTRKSYWSADLMAERKAASGD